MSFFSTTAVTISAVKQSGISLLSRMETPLFWALTRFYEAGVRCLFNEAGLEKSWANNTGLSSKDGRRWSVRYYIINFPFPRGLCPRFLGLTQHPLLPIGGLLLMHLSRDFQIKFRQETATLGFPLHYCAHGGGKTSHFKGQGGSGWDQAG